jgi:nucleotide-binding universal stress UspA family protein
VFRSILVAIDGSPAADAALEEAIDLARTDGARLVLISVAAPPRWRFTGSPYVPYPSDDELERAAWDVVRRAEALVPADVAVSSVVRVGSPAAAIVARAAEGGHDLVVIGSRGHGLMCSLLLGSVSRAVAARSPVPVLIARRRRDESRRAAGPPAQREVRAERSTAAVSMQAEPITRGALAVFLWLVVALLLELEVAWWIFDRMYAQ